MKLLRFLAIPVILAVIGINYTSSAPSLERDQTLQHVRNMTDGFPMIANLTQQVLAKPAQFRGSGLFFFDPCQFFQGLYRQFYCGVTSFDPQRSNPVVQGLLQFLCTNRVFFSFVSNCFCPFGTLGDGSFGSAQDQSDAGNAAIDCGIPGGARGNPPTGNLDDPNAFVTL